MPPPRHEWHWPRPRRRIVRHALRPLGPGFGRASLLLGTDALLRLRRWRGPFPRPLWPIRMPRPDDLMPLAPRQRPARPWRPLPRFCRGSQQHPPKTDLPIDAAPPIVPHLRSIHSAALRGLAKYWRPLGLWPRPRPACHQTPAQPWPIRVIPIPTVRLFHLRHGLTPPRGPYHGSAVRSAPAGYQCAASLGFLDRPNCRAEPATVVQWPMQSPLLRAGGAGPFPPFRAPPQPAVPRFPPRLRISSTRSMRHPLSR